MKNRPVDHAIILSVLVLSVLFTACEPKNKNLSVQTIQMNPEYFQDHPQAFPYKLYVFNSQEELDNFSENQTFECFPSVDFANQSLLLVWGKAGGKVVHIQPDFVHRGFGDYLLDLSLTTDLTDNSDYDWCYASVTNRKLQADERISFKLKIQNNDATNSFIPISIFPVDYGFCHENYQPDTLYVIHNAQEMNDFFNQYHYPLPEVDFSTQTLFLMYTYSIGHIVNRSTRIRENPTNCYDLNINIQETPSMIEGEFWVAAFWTYKNIQETDSVCLNVNRIVR